MGGGDKHGPKSGRYVGGFLQLFDWNAKSRKKLFPNKSDLSEQLKQGKKREGNLPVTSMCVVEDEEFGAGLSIRGGSEYSYASSVTDDDLYGTKAPGVVARLMGLDSLPTYPDPFSDTRSLQDSPLGGRNLDVYQCPQIMHPEHLSDKIESSSKVPMISRPQKTSIRPIEKFQSEILPPKSVKTIPITHHKLLSPIKSRIYVPTQDAAHIMEAAAKIIEPGPQNTSRAKISFVESSSVPFKVREMREKLEASQRSAKDAEKSRRQVESNSAKCLKVQPINKSWNGTDDSYSAVKSKGKSISLAIQAKVNVQKREGLTSGIRSFASEEPDGTKSSQSLGNQTSRKSLTESTSSVLRINIQKQNCPPYRDKPCSNTPVDKSAGKNSASEENSNGRQKKLTRDGGTSRTSSRKSSLQARDGDKRNPYSGARNAPRKKRSIDNMLVSKLENPSESSMTADRHFNWIEESRRKGMDVVSFSFTTPMTRSLRSSPVSETLRQLGEKGNDLFSDDRIKTLTNSDISKISSPGFNGIRGDALSILLEQKLKELASNLGSPHSFVKTSTVLESAHRTVFSPGSVESGTGKAGEKSAQRQLQVSCMNSQIFNFQAGEAVEDYDYNTGNKQWICQVPSPLSILEPSMWTERCFSLESLASSITEERKQCSSMLAQAVGMSSVQKFHPTDRDMDTSDSASSTLSQMIEAKDYMRTEAWELGYVKSILCNVELMFKDYATGRTREILNPCLFDQMERRRAGKSTQANELNLERKVLFDCVGECLNFKCQRFVEGRFQMWMKGIATLKRNERYAAEVYKEIQGWRKLGNSMVDEVVEKDMSSKYGKWLEFEVDEFMLSVEIEGQIIDSLVVELVVDLLPSRFLSSRSYSPMYTCKM